MTIYEEAVIKFGKSNQLLVTIGELAECSSEIAKFLVPQHSFTAKDEINMLNEIADVIIMMEQMKVIYGSRLDEAVKRKLKKVEKHVHG